MGAASILCKRLSKMGMGPRVVKQQAHCSLRAVGLQHRPVFKVPNEKVGEANLNSAMSLVVRKHERLP